ncbi:hypothetical protein [Paenibacillus sp. FSL H7-0756]|uniref:hypothetical protein n=1 Tax=Paenibacillus sp. FSL H7-0756 TaxID=2954738 RepID=UPI0030F6E514
MEAIERRIKNKASNFYADLATKNVQRSTFAVTGTVDEIAKGLNLEIKELFTRLHQLRICSAELKVIRNDLYSFVDKMFGEWKEVLIKRNVYKIGGEQYHEQFVNNRVTEVKVNINLEFLIVMEKIKARRRQLVWDISKIGITAIVGGFIGAYIKSFFP